MNLRGRGVLHQGDARMMERSNESLFPVQKKDLYFYMIFLTLQTQPHINYYNILTKFGDINSVVKELNSINIKNKHHMPYNNIILSDVYQIKAIDVNARKSNLLNLFGSHQYDNQIYSQLLSNHIIILIHLGKTLGNILNMKHVNDFTNDIKLINLGINHVSKN